MLPNSGGGIVLCRHYSTVCHRHLSTSIPSSPNPSTDIGHHRHYVPPTPMNEGTRQLFKRLNRWSFAGYWDSANQCAERYLWPSETKRQMYDFKRRVGVWCHIKLICEHIADGRL